MSAEVAPPENDDVLRAHGLQYSYDGSPALRDVALRVGAGELVTVTGPRGSGKSTLLACLSGRLPAESGEVACEGRVLAALPGRDRERLRRDRFGWVGSRPELLPELTAWENAALPLLLAGVRHRTAKRAAYEWLERLDIADCARHRPRALDIATRQRVAVARSLVHAPAVVLADEPAAPLHRADRTQVLRTLTSAARSHGIAVLLTGPEPGAGAGTEQAGTVSADRDYRLADGLLTPAAPPHQGGAGPEVAEGTAQADAPGGGNGTDDSKDRAACSLSA